MFMLWALLDNVTFDNKMLSITYFTTLPALRIICSKDQTSNSNDMVSKKCECKGIQAQAVYQIWK